MELLLAASGDLDFQLLGRQPLALPCYVAMHETLKASLRCRAVFDALVAGLQAYIA